MPILIQKYVGATAMLSTLKEIQPRQEKTKLLK